MGEDMILDIYVCIYICTHITREKENSKRRAGAKESKNKQESLRAS